MLNQVVLVGRIKKLGRRGIEINVPRLIEDKNIKEDLISISLNKSIIENLKSVAKIGDAVGVKGRLEKGCKVVAEKVTWLSHRD